MATRAKSTGSTARQGRKRKPATIDLEAKDVTAGKESAAKPADGKTPRAPDKDGDATSAAEKMKAAASNFGRPGEKQKASPEFATPASVTRALTGPGLGKMLVSSLFGGLITITGLGALGQIKGADRIPLIGSLFGGGQPEANQQSADVIAQLQTRLDQLAAAGKDNEPVDLAPLNAKITKLESAMAEIAANSGVPDTTAINNRISDLETSLDTLQSAVADISVTASNTTGDDNSPEIDRISSQLANLKDVVERLTIPDLEPLQTKIDATAATLATIRDTVGENTSGLTALAAKSGKLANQLDQARVSEKIARSVAANALGGALENGNSLNIPVSSIEALSGPTDETRRLSELSAAGIAGLNALKAEFAKLSSALETPKTAPADGGWVSRFVANAQSLVTIRPSGPVDGNTTTAILSRIRAHVNDDNLAAIGVEWGKLPEAARAKGLPWITRVNNRLEAFALYEKISIQLAQD